MPSGQVSPDANVPAPLPPIHPGVTVEDSFSVTSEAITGAVKGVVSVLRGSIERSGEIIGGADFTAAALKGSDVPEERYERLTQRGARVLRKHNVHFAYAEEAAYASDLVSIVGPLVLAAKTLSAKADEILAAKTQQANGGAA